MGLLIKWYAFYALEMTQLLWIPVLLNNAFNFSITLDNTCYLSGKNLYIWDECTRNTEPNLIRKIEFNKYIR